MSDLPTIISSVRTVQNALLAHSQVTCVPMYCESICWKLKALEHHGKLLCNINWDGLDRIGEFGPDPHKVLCGNADDVLIEIGSTTAAELIVLISLDGLVAASINVFDTLARMVNEYYELGVAYKAASLGNVLKELPANAPFRAAFDSPPGTGWLEPLRALRGECQHSNIVSVLTMPHGYFGMPKGELAVKTEYALPGQPDHKISTFVQEVRSRTIQLMTNSVAVLLGTPADACSAP